jgi:L-iditol 2-dehydrogenase
MKAALLTAIGKFEMADVPAPKIASEKDVLIRIKAAGICGSDVHYFTQGRIGSQVVQFPALIGHETAGVVEEVGKGVRKVKPGQRIAVEPTVFCGRCDQCKSGRENTCRALKFLGVPKELDGCFCQYVVLPEECCLPIPDSMTFETAVIAEPLSIALYSVKRSGVVEGSTVGILGAGPIGTSVMHSLRLMRTGNVYVTEKIDERLKQAQRLSPAWSGNPDRTDVVREISEREPLLLDVVYECSGDDKAIQQAIRILKPGGKLVLVGIPEVDVIPFPIHEIRRREITIVNIRRQAHCTEKAIEVLSGEIKDASSMVTHRFPLERIQDAFDLVSRYKDGVMKAVLLVD